MTLPRSHGSFGTVLRGQQSICCSSCTVLGGGRGHLSPHSHGLLVSLLSLCILALHQSDLYARSKGVAVPSPNSVQRSGSPRPLHFPHYLGGNPGDSFPHSCYRKIIFKHFIHFYMCILYSGILPISLICKYCID